MNDPRDIEPERRDAEDARLELLLRSVRAEADPALWTRVRARLAGRAEGETRGLLGWLTRPAALAGSIAVLGVASGASLALVRDMAPLDSPAGVSGVSEPGSPASLTDALLAVGSSPMDGLLAPGSATGGSAAKRDTGARVPREASVSPDSGGGP